MILVNLPRNELCTFILNGYPGYTNERMALPVHYSSPGPNKPILEKGNFSSAG